MLRLTVASVGGLGPVPLDLGSRTDIPSAAGHAAARAPPHSAWRGPPRVWGKETSASFRPDLRRTACGELVPRAGGQKVEKRDFSVFGFFAKKKLGHTALVSRDTRHEVYELV